MVKGIAVCLMGAAAMSVPSEATARRMFECPYTECVSACPQDLIGWCQIHGCETDEPSSNCGPLFNCSGNKVWIWCGGAIS
jgi:hypothetical protein